MIRYKVIKKPILGQDKSKYFATAITENKVQLKDLVKETAEKSELNLKTTEAAKFINDFFEVIKNHLDEGDYVKLGQFGSLSVSLKSEGQEEESQVNNSSIIKEKCKITFKNGKELKEITHNLTFKKEE